MLDTRSHLATNVDPWLNCKLQHGHNCDNGHDIYDPNVLSYFDDQKLSICLPVNFRIFFSYLFQQTENSQVLFYRNTLFGAYLFPATANSIN